MYFKLIKLPAYAAAALCCALAFGACGKSNGKTVNGDYHYDTDYGTYGVKVQVIVDDGVIGSVSITDSDYIEVSDGWEGSKLWYDGADALLAEYSGKTVEEVLAIEVSCSESGQPVSGQDLGGLIVSGSTQSSGRLLLAVQDALRNI